MKTKKITLQNFNIFVSKTQSLRVGVGYIYSHVNDGYIRFITKDRSWTASTIRRQTIPHSLYCSTAVRLKLREEVTADIMKNYNTFRRVKLNFLGAVTSSVL